MSSITFMLMPFFNWKMPNRREFLGRERVRPGRADREVRVKPNIITVYVDELRATMLKLYDPQRHRDTQPGAARGTGRAV